MCIYVCMNVGMHMYVCKSVSKSGASCMRTDLNLSLILIQTSNDFIKHQTKDLRHRLLCPIAN